MAQKDSSSKEHLFDGSNYSLWSVRMEAYLTTLGYDVWRAAKDNYIEPAHPITEANVKKAHKKNAKENNAILSGLKNYEFVKVV